MEVDTPARRLNMTVCGGEDGGVVAVDALVRGLDMVIVWGVVMVFDILVSGLDNNICGGGGGGGYGAWHPSEGFKKGLLRPGWWRGLWP